MQLSNVDLNLLVVLEALLDTASVQKAARRLGRSPSATSHALNRLRDLLGDPLLVRAGRTLTLTPRAERLRPRVQQAIEEVRGVLRFEEALDPSRLERTFRAAVTDYAKLVVVRPLSDALHRSAPGVSIYASALAGDVLPRLRDGEVDLAIGVFFDMPADISRERLLHDDFVCLLREGHPALSGVWDLAAYTTPGHVLVTSRGDPRGVVDVHLERAGTSRRIARTAASFQVAPMLVADTDLVVTVPSRLADEVAGPLRLARRTPPVPLRGFDLEMIWHRRNDGDAGHRWFREQALDVVG